MSDPEVKVVCAEEPANNNNPAILKVDQLQDEEIQKLQKEFLMIDNVRKLEERNVKGLRNSYLKLSHKNKIDRDKISYLSKGLQFIEDEKNKIVSLQNVKKRVSERCDLQNKTMKEINVELINLQKRKLQTELELKGRSTEVEDELSRKETESDNNTAILECMMKAMDNKFLDMQCEEMDGVEEDAIPSSGYFQQIDNLQEKEFDASKENDKGVDCGIEKDEMEEEKMLERISDKVTRNEKHVCLIAKKIEYRKYLIDLLLLEKEQWRKGIDRLYQEEEENTMKIKDIDLPSKDEELRGHMMKSALLESEIAKLEQQLKVKKRATKFMKWKLIALQRDVNLAETGVNFKKEGSVLNGIFQRPKDFQDTMQTHLPKILSRDELGKGKKGKQPAQAVKQVPLTGQDEKSSQNRNKKDYDDNKNLASPDDKHKDKNMNLRRQKKSKVVCSKKGQDCNNGNSFASTGKRISSGYSDKDGQCKEASLECQDDYSVQGSGYDKEKNLVPPDDKHKDKNMNLHRQKKSKVLCSKKGPDCNDGNSLASPGRKIAKGYSDKNRQCKEASLECHEDYSVQGNGYDKEKNLVSPQKTKYRNNYSNKLENEWRESSKTKGNHICDKGLVSSPDTHYVAKSPNSNQPEQKANPCSNKSCKEEKDCHDQKQLVSAGKKSTKATCDKNKQLKKELLDHNEACSGSGEGSLDEECVVAPQKTKYRTDYFNELENEWRDDRQSKGSKHNRSHIRDKRLGSSPDKHYKEKSANDNQPEEKVIPCNNESYKEEKDYHDEKQLESAGKKSTKANNDKNKQLKKELLDHKEVCSLPRQGALDKERVVAPQKTKYRTNYFNELESEWRDDRQCKGSKQKGSHIRDQELVSSTDKHCKANFTNDNQSEDKVIPCNEKRHKEKKDCQDEKQLDSAYKKNTKGNKDKNKQLKKKLLDHNEACSLPAEGALNEERVVASQRTKYRANYFNEFENEWRDRHCKGSKQKGHHIRDKGLVSSTDKHYKAKCTNSNQPEEKVIPCNNENYKEEKDCHDEKQLDSAGKKNTKANKDKNKQLKKDLLDYKEVCSVPEEGALDEESAVLPQKTKYRANYFNELEVEWRDRHCKGSKQKGHHIHDKGLVSSTDKHYKAKSTNSNQPEEKVIPCNNENYKEEKDCHDEKQLDSAGKKNTKANKDKNKQLKKDLLDYKEVCSVPEEGALDEESAVLPQKTKYRANYFNELEVEWRDRHCKGSKQKGHHIHDKGLVSSTDKHYKAKCTNSNQPEEKVIPCNNENYKEEKDCHDEKQLDSADKKNTKANKDKNKQLKKDLLDYKEVCSVPEEGALDEESAVLPQKTKYRANYFNELEVEWRDRHCKGSKQKGHHIHDKGLVSSTDKHYKAKCTNSNQPEEKVIPCNNENYKEEKDCHDEKQLDSADKKNTKANKDKNKQLKKDLLDYKEVCSVPEEGALDEESAVLPQKTKYRANYFNELEGEWRDDRQCKGYKLKGNHICNKGLASSNFKERGRYLKGLEGGRRKTTFDRHKDGTGNRVDIKSLMSFNAKKNKKSQFNQKQLNEEERSYQDPQVKQGRGCFQEGNLDSPSKEKYRTRYFDEMQDEWLHDKNHAGHYYQRNSKSRKDSKLDNGTTRTRKGRRRLSTKKFDN